MKLVIWCAVLLCPLVVSAVSEQLNGTVSFNISYLVNDSVGNGSLAWPGGVFFFTPSLNLSGLWNFSLLGAEWQNASLNLSHGQNASLAGCYENMSVACENLTTIQYVNQSCVNQTIVNDSGVCVVHRNMHQGEWYGVNDSQCDVYFTCANECDFNETNTFSLTQSVMVRKDGNILTVSNGNDTRVLDLRQLNDSADMSLNVTCPILPFEQVSPTAIQEGWNYCQSFFPMFAGWFNNTLNTCMGNMQGYRDYVQKRTDADLAANQALSDCRAISANMSGELVVMTSRLAYADSQNRIQDDTINNDHVALAAAIIFLVISLVGNAILWSENSTGGD
jgi:hypothetical protein